MHLDASSGISDAFAMRSMTSCLLTQRAFSQLEITGTSPHHCTLITRSFYSPALFRHVPAVLNPFSCRVHVSQVSRSIDATTTGLRHHFFPEAVKVKLQEAGVDVKGYKVECAVQKAEAECPGGIQRLIHSSGRIHRNKAGCHTRT